MRCLERDKRLVYAAFFVDKKPVVDEQGRLTGRYDVERTEPVPLLLSVSASKGSAENSPFGIDLDYDRTLVVEDLSLPVDESTVFWIDNVFRADAPDDEVDPGFNRPLSDRPHDYTVKRVARTSNSVAVAVKHVEVSR